jgi:hypothetical protein
MENKLGLGLKETQTTSAPALTGALGQRKDVVRRG